MDDCYSSVDLTVPTILRPRVRIPSTKSTLSFFQFKFELWCEKNENLQKEAGIGPFKKSNKIILISKGKFHCTADLLWNLSKQEKLLFS